MVQASDTPRSVREAGIDVSDQSFGELLGAVSHDLSTLMRQEVELAKAELREEAGKAGKAAGMLGAAGVATHMLLLFLSLAVWAGLSNVMDPGWAALIVGVVWGIVAAALYASGRSKMQRVRGLRRTAATMQEIPDALKPERGGA